MTETLAIFGGTFDPIHFGHLNLALSLKEAHGLKEVVFVPAFQNPLKPSTTSIRPASDAERLAMIKLAIDEIPGFSVDDRELKRKGISYTFDTIKELLAQFKSTHRSCRLILLLGEDSAVSFGKWHRANEIIEKVDLLVGERPGYTLNFPKTLDSKIENALIKGVTPIPRMDISSTEIRERIAKGLYCGHLLPAKVLDYIKAHRLYYMEEYGKKDVTEVR